MFGIFDDLAKTASDLTKDPVGTTARVVTQPVRDGLEVVDGLTEGELRTKAAARLGVDVASGMAVGELVEWYNSES